MRDQGVQQALPTGTWSPDAIHSTVGHAVPYMAGTFQGQLFRLRGAAERWSAAPGHPALANEVTIVADLRLVKEF
jgi:hypothetical protein